MGLVTDLGRTSTHGSSLSSLPLGSRLCGNRALSPMGGETTVGRGKSKRDAGCPSDSSSKRPGKHGCTIKRRRQHAGDEGHWATPFAKRWRQWTKLPWSKRCCRKCRSVPSDRHAGATRSRRPTARVRGSRGGNRPPHGTASSLRHWCPCAHSSGGMWRSSCRTPLSRKRGGMRGKNVQASPKPRAGDDGNRLCTCKLST